MKSYSTNQTSNASSKAFTTSDIYYQSVLLKARILKVKEVEYEQYQGKGKRGI